jgi:hypothetical protein
VNGGRCGASLTPTAAVGKVHGSTTATTVTGVVGNAGNCPSIAVEVSVALM